MLVDKQSELMSDRFFTVHQHGGDDVTWKSGKQLNCKMESKVKINKKQCTFAKIRFPHKKHIERREEIRDSPCLKDLALSRRIGAQSVFVVGEICELRLHAVTCLASHYVEKQHRTNNEPQNRIK